MKPSHQGRRWRRFAWLAVAGCAAFSWNQAGHAMPIDALIDPNATQPLRLDWGAGGGTGILLQNPPGVGGKVSIELLDGPAPPLAAPDGFVLLDNTLRVSSSLPSEGLRMRASMGIRVGQGRRIPVRLRGLRPDSLRLLRADFASGRWIRAINSIRARERADIRMITDGRADFTLGHFGIDSVRQTVWAVVDTSGEQLFAIGAKRVPEPVGWLLLVTGAAFFAVARRRTRAEARAR